MTISPTEQRCRQCWKFKPAQEFLTNRGNSVKWCADCRGLYRSGGVAETRRAGLSSARLRVLTVDKSMNRKLGQIPATTTSGETCPDSCSFKDHGCYAEFGLLKYHWRRAAEFGKTWHDFLRWVVALPKGTLWRHNVAGDLPGNGDKVDVRRAKELAACSVLSRGFTFTHKPISAGLRKVLLFSRDVQGICINLSADNLQDADRKASFGLAPVAVTVSPDHPVKSHTPAGRKVIVCPAERKDTNCSKCQLCANWDREVIIAFRAHGQWKKKVSELVQLRT